jgi:amino acid transporter
MLTFLKEIAWPFGFFGGIYAIGTRFIGADAQLNAWAVLASYVGLAAIIVCLIGYATRRPSPGDHPKIDIEQVRENGTLLIVKKTPALGVNMGAMIYIRDGVYERLIAVGTVSHVQTDGSTQLSIRYVPAIEPDLLTKISQNLRSTLSEIVVRPGVRIDSTSYIEAEQ